MGQVVSFAERANGHRPFVVGKDATFMFARGDQLELVSGPIAKLTETHVAIDDFNVDGSYTRFNVPVTAITDRFE